MATREAIRVQQPDGSFKIVFRDSNTSNPAAKDNKQIERATQGNGNKDNKGNKQKKEKDPEKMRYLNPRHPGHVDIFGKDLIGIPIIITLVNGESINCKMTGYAQYEILVEYEGKRVILLKQGILKIEIRGD